MRQPADILSTKHFEPGVNLVMCPSMNDVPTHDLTSPRLDRRDISVPLVAALISEQFPQWAHLPIRAVIPSGWDNRTFRIGDEMLVRLPSGAGYAAQVEREQKWLPLLAPQLQVHIPTPVAMGRPSQHYPWNWSIYRWIDGENAEVARVKDQLLLARELAGFLRELHKADPSDGPLPGAHNYFRGGALAVYSGETNAALATLADHVDVSGAKAVWDRALASHWPGTPKWVHGDFSPGNILIRDGRLAAVIDFGCMGVGDPACDLVMAWTFFSGESRKVFMSEMELDGDAWARARGWALWKALITLAASGDLFTPESTKKRQIIDEVISDL